MTSVEQGLFLVGSNYYLTFRCFLVTIVHNSTIKMEIVGFSILKQIFGSSLDDELFLLYNSVQIDQGKRDYSVRREFVNEKHIQRVLEIEKKAQEIHEAAIKEAQQLPVTAEQEAQALVEKALVEAEQKARQMVAEVKADEESARILSETEEKNKQFEALATSNLDRAVAYVLERVIGRA